MRGAATTLRIAALVVALALLVYAFATGSYLLTPLGFALVYAVFVSGLNVFMGYAGQVSFGQNAFAAIGGYGSAVLTATYEWQPLAAFLVSLLAAAIVALLIGLITLRLRGHYLAMATLAVGLISYELSVQWESVTQGYTGISGIPPFGIGTLEAGTDRQQFVVLCVFVAASLWVLHRLRRSRFGRALHAIAGSEDAAGALGISVVPVKLAAFVVAAMFASAAGSLLAHFVGLRQPGDVRPAHGRAGLHHALCRRHRHGIRTVDRRRGDRHVAGADPSAARLPGPGLRRGADRDPDPRAEGPRRAPRHAGGAPGSAPMSTLELQGLTKRFGGLVAVDGVGFTLPVGGINALIGPNRRRQDHAVQHDRR